MSVIILVLLCCIIFFAVFLYAVLLSASKDQKAEDKDQLAYLNGVRNRGKMPESDDAA